MGDAKIRYAGLRLRLRGDMITPASTPRGHDNARRPNAGVTPRSQLSMLPSTPPAHQQGESCLATGSLNTARSFCHGNQLNESGKFQAIRLSDRRGRRSSLPTVSELEPGCASRSTSTQQVPSHDSVGLEANSLGFNSVLKAPPAVPQPPSGARGAPRVHTPLPASLVESLGGRSAGWLTRRSHMRSTRHVNLFEDPRIPAPASLDMNWGETALHGSLYAPLSAHENITNRSRSMVVGMAGSLREGDSLTHREPVAGRRARPNGCASSVDAGIF